MICRSIYIPNDLNIICALSKWCEINNNNNNDDDGDHNDNGNDNNNNNNGDKANIVNKTHQGY